MPSLATCWRPTVLVTGSTDGIGLTTAKNMAAKGYHVIVHGRDECRISQACESVRAFRDERSSYDDTSNKIFPIQADLSTVTESTRMAFEVKQLCQAEELDLTVLMNNAGVYSESRVHTADGTEQTFAVNVLATFVITSHLLPTLLKSTAEAPDEASRIIIASSISQGRTINHWDDLQYHSRPFSAHGSYSESKLLDAMLCFDMAKRLETIFPTSTITCNCLDPGTVNTKMLLAGWGPCGIDVSDALDETYLCSSPEVQQQTGNYYNWRSPRRASASAYKESEQRKLWKICSEFAPDAATVWENLSAE